MTDYKAQVNEARRAHAAVYLATESDVADDLSRIIRGLADAVETLVAQLDSVTVEWGVRVTVPNWTWVENLRSREECERFIAHPPLRYIHQVGESFSTVTRTAASPWVEATDPIGLCPACGRKHPGEPTPGVCDE